MPRLAPLALALASCCPGFAGPSDATIVEGAPAACELTTVQANPWLPEVHLAGCSWSFIAWYDCDGDGVGGDAFIQFCDPGTGVGVRMAETVSPVAVTLEVLSWPGEQTETPRYNDVIDFCAHHVNLESKQTEVHCGEAVLAAGIDGDSPPCPENCERVWHQEISDLDDWGEPVGPVQRGYLCCPEGEESCFP